MQLKLAFLLPKWESGDRQIAVQLPLGIKNEKPYINETLRRAYPRECARCKGPLYSQLEIMDVELTIETEVEVVNG